VFVLITPRLRGVAQQWLRENYSKTIKFEDKNKEHKCSVKIL